MKYRYTAQQLQKMEQCRYLTDRERRVFNLVCRRGWAIEDAAAEPPLSPVIGGIYGNIGSDQAGRCPLCG